MSSIPSVLKHLAGRPMLGRYEIVPWDIFRVQSGRNTTLRTSEAQQCLGKAAFDLVLHEDGLVHPVSGHLYLG